MAWGGKHHQEGSLAQTRVGATLVSSSPHGALSLKLGAAGPALAENVPALLLVQGPV